MDQNNPQKTARSPTTSPSNQVNDQTSPTTPSSSSTATTGAGDVGRGRYVRSYTCTFCEKGFSNAQALGGHMNIHRRDRARLRNSHEPESRSKDDDSLATILTWNPGHRDHLPIIHRPQTSDEHQDRQVLDLFVEEVDLELRLGPHKASSTPSSSSSGPSKGS